MSFDSYKRFDPFSSPEKLWLVRFVVLALLVGFWLQIADSREKRRVADELRARGWTTTARDPLDEPFERLTFQSLLRLTTAKTYRYVVAGVEFRATTTQRYFDPIGETVTYLPEDPNVHQVGEIHPAAGSPLVISGLYLFLVVVLVFLTVGFFVVVLFPPAWYELTRAGVFCVVGLAAFQFTVGLVATTFFQVPFDALLVPGIPLFVGGSVAAVVAVRLVARKCRVPLWESSDCDDLEPLRPDLPDELLPPEPDRLTSASSVPTRAESPTSIPPIIFCPTCFQEFSAIPNVDGLVTCPQGHSFVPECWFDLDCTNPRPVTPDFARGRELRDPPSEGVRIRADLMRLSNALLGIPAGAIGCLVPLLVVLFLMHLVAGIMTVFGATTDFNTSFTSRDSIAIDLLFGAFVSSFGAMRGMAHGWGRWQRVRNWKHLWMEIAEKSGTDLMKMRDYSEHAVGKLVALVVALVLTGCFCIWLVQVWD